MKPFGDVLWAKRAQGARQRVWLDRAFPLLDVAIATRVLWVEASSR